MVVVIIIIIILALATFMLGVVIGADQDDAREDEEQMEYLRKWREENKGR